MGNSSLELNPQALPYVPTAVADLSTEDGLSRPSDSELGLLHGDSDPPDISLGMSESLLIFPVSVGDESSTALLDTGASVNLMTSSLAGTLNLKLGPCSQSVIGLAGTRVFSMGRITVPIKVGAIVFDTEFVVLPNSAMRHPIILGSDFFSKYNVQINLSYSRFSGSHEWGSWELYLVDENVVQTVFKKVDVVAAIDMARRCGDCSL